MSRKILYVLLLVAISSAVVLGYLYHKEKTTPRAAVWSTEKTILPTPYCPRCQAEVTPFGDNCQACGGPLSWPNRDAMKEKLKSTREGAGQLLEDGAEAADRALQDAEKWAREQYEKAAQE